YSQFARIHRLHARRADGTQPQVRVLVRATKFRLDADSPSGFQKNVRRGLLVLHHLARHHGGEKVADVQVFEDLTDDALRAAGRHGHWNLAMMRLRDFDDGVDWLNLRHQWQIRLLLLVGDGDVVERTALLRREHFQNVAR